MVQSYGKILIRSGKNKSKIVLCWVGGNVKEKRLFGI